MGILVFIIMIIIVVVIICRAFSNADKDNYSYNNYSDTKINGVNIHLTEAEIAEMNRKKREKEFMDFNFERERLLEIIKTDADCSDELIRRKVLEELSKTEVKTPTDLEHLKYLYNDGNLRSNEEVEAQERYVKYADKRKNYNTERHTVNVIAFLAPFSIVLVIATAWLCNGGLVLLIALIIGLVPALIAGMIGMMIGYSININNAKKYGISDRDPRVQKEKLKRKVGVASSIAAGASMAKSTKKAIKDIGNVDSWPKMK